MAVGSGNMVVTGLVIEVIIMTIFYELRRRIAVRAMYEEDDRFREYVNKYATNMNCSINEVFSHAIVWEVCTETYERRKGSI